MITWQCPQQHTGIIYNHKSRCTMFQYQIHQAHPFCVNFQSKGQQLSKLHTYNTGGCYWLPVVNYFLSRAYIFARLDVNVQQLHIFQVTSSSGKSFRFTIISILTFFPQKQCLMVPVTSFCYTWNRKK